MEPLHFCRGFTLLVDTCSRPLECVRRPRYLTGFTLIELVVVLAIIITVTSIALTSQNTFNKTLVLANTAYDIALTLRSAESFGIGNRAIGSVSNAGYGLHFHNGSPGSFVLFADTYPPVPLSCTRPDCKPGDRLYSSEDTIVQTYVLGNGIVVSNFCASLDRIRCVSTGDLQSLDIVFARPNPDAYIRANGSSFNSYTQACLVVASSKGGLRYISVASSGQIIANAASCP